MSLVERRIFHINDVVTAVQNTQLCIEDVVDPDLGYYMWAGKDAAGNTTKWLAKSKPAFIDTLRIEDTAGGNAGILRHDTSGDVTGDLMTVAQLNSYLSDGPIGGTTVHNNLTGIQGGTAAEYYHLTAADYALYATNTPFTANAILFVDSSANLNEDTNFYWDESNACLTVYCATNPSLFATPAGSTNVALRIENLESTNTSEVLKIYSASAASTGYGILFQGAQGAGETADEFGHLIWSEGSVTLGHGTGVASNIHRSYVTCQYDDASSVDWATATLGAEASTAWSVYARIKVSAGDYGGVAGKIDVETTGPILIDAGTYSTIETGSGDLHLVAGSELTFADGYLAASTWTTAEVPFAESAAEISAMRTLLGDTEGSVCAMIAAASGGTVAAAGQIIYGNSGGTGVTSEANFHWDATNDELTVTNDVNKTYWYDADAAAIRLAGTATQGMVISSDEDLTIGVRKTDASDDSNVSILAEAHGATSDATMTLRAYAPNGTGKIDVTGVDDFDLNYAKLYGLQNVAWGTPTSATFATNTVTANFSTGKDIQQVTATDDIDTLTLTAPTGGAAKGLQLIIYSDPITGTGILLEGGSGWDSVMWSSNRDLSLTGDLSVKDGQYAIISLMYDDGNWFGSVGIFGQAIPA